MVPFAGAEILDALCGLTQFQPRGSGFFRFLGALGVAGSNIWGFEALGLGGLHHQPQQACRLRVRTRVRVECFVVLGFMGINSATGNVIPPIVWLVVSPCVIFKLNSSQPIVTIAPDSFN